MADIHCHTGSVRAIGMTERPELPSIQAARTLEAGDRMGVPMVLNSMLQRSGLITVALILGGMKDTKEILRYAAITTVVIEVSVLVWMWSRMKPDKAPPVEPPDGQ